MDRAPDLLPARPRTSYLMRHWRGELSLARSFWVNSVLLSLVWLPMFGLEPLIRAYPPSPTTLIVALGVLLVSMTAMAVWQGVGTWRSARRHRAQGGSMLWVRVACGLILLDCAYTLYSVVEDDSLAVLKSAWQVWHAPDQLPPSHITLLAPDELVIAGGWSLGSADAVRDVLDAHPAVTRVQLDSGGGLLLEAQGIARQVRQKGLITYTDGDCMSACTLVFQAGKERWLGPEGRLGFHAGALYGSDQQPEAITQIYRHTLQDSGLSEDFIQRVLNTPQDAMWFPDVGTLRSEHIITGLADPADFTDRRLASLREPARLDAYLRSSLLFRILEQKAPEQFAAEKRRIAEALGNARQFRLFNAATTQRQNELLRLAILQAPDGVAMDYWRSQFDYLAALEQVGADACWGFLTGKDVRSQVPAQAEADLQAARMRLFEATLPLREDDPPAQATLDADLDAIFKRVEQRLPQAYEHLHRRDRDTLCTVYQAVYHEALAMADQKRATAVLMGISNY
ncbi:hypothetical protein F3J45_06660 [Pantoea sp. Ap-967]|uniref:COG3904 family protein n=1 Tax=Pantoea sp. Ap-967 TaxID=2608362 RepID=UPI0014240642|nr:hypothetical protein [Pantoea sp. Ap-967]NIE74126.1 hypothetical protein [Pantoea sp. Ap-967]